jgi:hypothetical protein
MTGDAKRVKNAGYSIGDCRVRTRFSHRSSKDFRAESCVISACKFFIDHDLDWRLDAAVHHERSKQARILTVLVNSSAALRGMRLATSTGGCQLSHFSRRSGGRSSRGGGVVMTCRSVGRSLSIAWTRQPISSFWSQCLRLLFLCLYALMIGGCTSSAVTYVPPPTPAPVVYTPPPPPPAPPKPSDTIIADASWYGPGFDGHKTATGERFSSHKMTAAAKGLPLGSRVVVTNLNNGRSASVRINDCGPYWRKRKLDVSKSAANKLGLIHDGTAKVRIKIVHQADGAPICPSSI